jgi:hypothetical protein
MPLHKFPRVKPDSAMAGLNTRVCTAQSLHKSLCTPNGTGLFRSRLTTLISPGLRHLRALPCVIGLSQGPAKTNKMTSSIVYVNHGKLCVLVVYRGILGNDHLDEQSHLEK